LPTSANLASTPLRRLDRRRLEVQERGRRRLVTPSAIAPMATSQGELRGPSLAMTLHEHDPSTSLGAAFALPPAFPVEVEGVPPAPVVGVVPALPVVPAFDIVPAVPAFWPPMPVEPPRPPAAVEPLDPVDPAAPPRPPEPTDPAAPPIPLDPPEP
jgi:hypothetical protein